MQNNIHIEKRSLEVQAADAIRQRIVAGVLLAGERLTEIRLSEEMNLSRGTIRAALLRLMSEGLVDQVPYSGWSVVELTSRDVWELYTLRSSLEALAARLAATNLTENASEMLQSALENMVAACHKKDLLSIADADFAMHSQIIQVSGHSRLQQQYTALEHQIRMYITTSDSLVDSHEDIIDQHRPLIKAILAGDAEASDDIARNHNLSEGQKLFEHFRKFELNKPFNKKIVVALQSQA